MAVEIGAEGRLRFNVSKEGAGLNVRQPRHTGNIKPDSSNREPVGRPRGRSDLKGKNARNSGHSDKNVHSRNSVNR